MLEAPRPGIDRADPFDEWETTRWEFMNVRSGRIDVLFDRYGNEYRKVAWNERRDRPEDVAYQDPDGRPARAEIDVVSGGPGAQMRSGSGEDMLRGLLAGVEDHDVHASILLSASCGLVGCDRE